MLFARRFCVLGFAIGVNLCFLARAQATLTADAGPDQSVGYDVPVILDGNRSNDSGGASLTYLWQQTAGSPHLDMIGQDRVKPMIISAHTAGTYTFTLTVNNGTTTATDTMTLTISAPTGTFRYVDNQLRGTTSTYSIANRNNNGRDGYGYASLQAAANAVHAGDTVYVRAGNYSEAYAAQDPTTLINMTRSGTATRPIRFQNYNGEYVTLVGLGFSDVDGNGDGYADGPYHGDVHDYPILINPGADYIQIVGLEVRNSGLYNAEIEGSYFYMQDCKFHDSWQENVYVQNFINNTTQRGVVLRDVEAFNGRHGSGVSGGPPSGTTTYNAANMTEIAVVDCLLYANGYQPDGNRVLPILGDPQGGGNSDGFTVSKTVANNIVPNNPPIANLAHNWYLVRDIAYHNCDDNIDLSFQDSLVEDCWALSAGPTGRNAIKVFTQSTKIVFRGNLCYWNMGKAIENRQLAYSGPRPTPGPVSPQATVYSYQNTMIRNQQGGFCNLPANYSYGENKNNLSEFNLVSLDAFYGLIGSTLVNENNWFKDGSENPAHRGDAYLPNDNLGNPYIEDLGGQTRGGVNWWLDLNFDPNASTATKRQYIINEVAPSFTPQSDSGLVDQGEVIPGYHCPTADDDPVHPASPDDPRRHWFGAAPDIGAFEYNPHP
jgi:hypothetical protein